MIITMKCYNTCMWIIICIKLYKYKVKCSTLLQKFHDRIIIYICKLHLLSFLFQNWKTTGQHFILLKFRKPLNCWASLLLTWTFSLIFRYDDRQNNKFFFIYDELVCWLFLSTLKCFLFYVRDFNFGSLHLLKNFGPSLLLHSWWPSAFLIVTSVKFLLLLPQIISGRVHGHIPELLV